MSVPARFQKLITDGHIKPALYTAAADLAKYADDNTIHYFVVGGLAALLQGFDRATADIDVRLAKLTTKETKILTARTNWQIQTYKPKVSAPIPDNFQLKQIKAKYRVGSDNIKIDGVLVPTADYTLYASKNLINTVDGIKVASPTLLALIKMKTLIERQNEAKLGKDALDLQWCLEQMMAGNHTFPADVLKAAFGWTKEDWKLMFDRQPGQQVKDRTKLLLNNVGCTEANFK